MDAIFAQWGMERPDIDATPVRIYGIVAQPSSGDGLYINKALAPLGLVRGTFDVLTALRRNGAPYSLRPKQLATALLLSGAGLASRIDQLEALRPERGRLIVREDSGIRNVRDIKGKASH